MVRSTPASRLPRSRRGSRAASAAGRRRPPGRARRSPSTRPRPARRGARLASFPAGRPSPHRSTQPHLARGRDERQAHAVAGRGAPSPPVPALRRRGERRGIHAPGPERTRRPRRSRAREQPSARVADDDRRERERPRPRRRSAAGPSRRDPPRRPRAARPAAGRAGGSPGAARGGASRARPRAGRTAPGPGRRSGRPCRGSRGAGRAASGRSRGSARRPSAVASAAPRPPSSPATMVRATNANVKFEATVSPRRGIEPDAEQDRRDRPDPEVEQPVCVFLHREPPFRSASPRAKRRSSSRFSSSTLTRGSPSTPNVRGSTRERTSASTSPAATPRAAATRGTCHSAASGLRCGSRPLADVVTSSSGTGPGACGFSGREPRDVAPRRGRAASARSARGSSPTEAAAS